jgi:ssRNA-specific RNase YbeY (16S rRNA maturation enzyme)
MGWGHENDADAEAMERREREILALVGVDRR